MGRWACHGYGTDPELVSRYIIYGVEQVAARLYFRFVRVCGVNFRVLCSDVFHHF
jgi:hypothetical protein